MQPFIESFWFSLSLIQEYLSLDLFISKSLGFELLISEPLQFPASLSFASASLY